MQPTTAGYHGLRHIIFPSKTATKAYVANKKKGSKKPGGWSKKRQNDTLSETARIGHHHLLSDAKSEESGNQKEDDRNAKERDERREMPPSFSITHGSRPALEWHSTPGDYPCNRKKEHGKICGVQALRLYFPTGWFIAG
jgi:hypothetical protein